VAGSHVLRMRCQGNAKVYKYFFHP
jgi:hypothetical protein